MVPERVSAESVNFRSCVGNTTGIVRRWIRSITGIGGRRVGRRCRRLRGLRAPRCSRRHCRRGRCRRDGVGGCVRRRNGRYRIWYHRLNWRYHRHFRRNRRRADDGRRRRDGCGDDCGGVGQGRRRIVCPGGSRARRQCRCEKRCRVRHRHGACDRPRVQEGKYPEPWRTIREILCEMLFHSLRRSS